MFYVDSWAGLAHLPRVVRYFIERNHPGRCLFSPVVLLLLGLLLPFGLTLGVSDFTLDEAEEDKCVWAFTFTSVIFKHSAELHTWFGAILYFLGPSMHLSLSLGGPPSLPLALQVKRTSGGGSFGF